MAKVLACPSCGHKHSLDQMMVVNDFSCKECGKTLVVPEAAKEFMANNLAEELEENKEIVVVAHSSLSHESPAIKTPIADIENASIQVVGKSGTLISDTSTDEDPEERKSEEAKSQNIAARGLSSFQHPISSMGKTISWLVAIPAGFIIVVIVPRLLGFGFHASDFVGVITMPGLSRFKIVFTLIFLWSIATVLCIPVVQGLWRRVFRRKSAIA